MVNDCMINKNKKASGLHMATIRQHFAWLHIITVIISFDHFLQWKACLVFKVLHQNYFSVFKIHNQEPLSRRRSIALFLPLFFFYPRTVCTMEYRAAWKSCRDFLLVWDKGNKNWDKRWNGTERINNISVTYTGVSSKAAYNLSSCHIP